MLLSKLEWNNVDQLGDIEYAFAARPSQPSSLDCAIVWRFLDGTYTIVDRRVPPRSEWNRVDELTAECILIELMKSPHDAGDNPER